MSNPQTQNNNLSTVEQALNWIGDKLLEARNYVEVDLGTQQFINGMNVTENYKVIYEKLNNVTNSEWSVKLASQTGAIVQAYTGPTLYYTVGKFTEGLSNVFGDSVAKGMDVLIGNVDSNNSLLAAYARVGEVAGNATASGLSKVLNWGEDIFGNNDPDKKGQSILISTPSNSSTPNSVTINQSTNPATNKSSVSISSNNYTKDQLADSSKSLIKNEGKKLVGSNIKIEGNNGTINTKLLNDSLKSEADKFFAKNSKLDAPILSEKDDSGNSLYLFESDEDLTLSDGSTSTLGTVLNAIDSAKTTAETFINGYMGQVKEMLTSQDAIAGLIADVAAGIQRGDSPEEIARFVATKLAVKQLLEQGSDAVKNQIQQLLVDNPADLAAIEAGDYLSLSSEGAESLRELDAITNSSAFNFGYKVAIVYATTMLLNADEGWDSQEYTEAAVHAVAQVTTQVAVSIAVKEGWLGSSAAAGPAGAGVGAFAAYMASTAINDLFADDHMNSHQWQSAAVSAAVIGVASAISWALGGPIGAVVASVIVSQFMGGKEYGAGEYPDPYSYLRIEAKADGTGNKIIGIEPEGVVAIAREYYHDDLYGNSGSYNLIGKSGTNTIYGYGGNDHLEGRGDIDLLVAGNGDDEAFGGNGDDQIYGGNGSDNLFGGNGNDIIIGGTGASISGEGSLEDGNDFIRGGTGNERIEGTENIVANDNFQQLLKSKFKRKVRL